MPDESHKDETCKSHITLVQLLLNFILYHMCNFPVFVSILNSKLFRHFNFENVQISYDGFLSTGVARNFDWEGPKLEKNCDVV